MMEIFLIDYSKQITVLYVEDDKDVRLGYERALKRYVKKLFVAKDGLEGLEVYKLHKPDIIISDINMPNKNGIDMAKEIKEIKKDQAIIFTTAHTESKYTLEALKMQADGYMVKPINKKNLREKVEEIARHITLEKESIKNQKILQKILDNQTSITVLTDFENIEFASKSFFSLFEVENKNEFFQTYPNMLDIFVKHDNYINGSDKYEFLKKYSLAGDENKIVSIAALDGDVKAFFIEIDMVDDLYILTLTDITDIQKEKLRAEHTASYDRLTSVYNRAKFEEIFEIKFHSAKRYKRELSVAILDIDHFKNVNDTYGHLIGDKILKLLATTCLKSIRKTDIFARWGGEEFVLLMDETDLNSAKFVCENLRITIEKMTEKNLPQITVSIGITSINDKDTKSTLFERADKALYFAKQSGRNRVEMNE